MNGPTVADFLAFRFRHNGPDDYIELRPLDQHGKQVDRSWTNDPAVAARRALALDKGLAIYYGVSARKRGKGQKHDVTSIPGLWADIDFKHFPDGEAGAWAALEVFPLAPTWVIHSGGGLQGYWDFTAPITTPAQFPAVEALLARLYGAFGGLDSVQDVSRIFRVPQTFNNKPEYGTPRPVTIARHNLSALYTLADFERLLPAPQEEERPRAAYPQGTHRSGDVPTVDEVAEMLRHINPQPGYHKWLSLLAAVHSAYPGSDGIALCEAWSGHASKPGEIAAKFASFGNYKGEQGKGPATIATVIYEAKQGGYRPPQTTYHTSYPENLEGYVAADAEALLTQLRADVQRLGDELRERDARIEQLEGRLRYADEEGERQVLRITELELENRLLHETRQHADQTVAANVWDAAAALKKRYDRGEVKTEDGQDLAPVISKYDATTGSPATLGRCITRLEDTGVKVRRYEKTIKSESGNDVKVKIPHLFIPPEHRASVPAIVRFLLPPSPAKKKQGGSKKRIDVPKSAEHPDAPLIRRLETIETFRAMPDPGKVIPGSERLLTASETYYTKDGEPITKHEAHRIQVEIGYEPPPWWNTAPQSDRLQVDYLPKNVDGFQVEIGPEPEPEPLHGRCRYCGRPNLAGKHHCERHQPGGDAWQAAVADRQGTTGAAYAYAVGDD